MKYILEYKSQEPLMSLDFIKNYFGLSCDSKTIKKVLNNAIEHLELENGISLQRKIWKVIHDNNLIILSFAPITKILETCDGMGQVIEPLMVKRFNDSVSLQFHEAVTMIKVTYEVGYDQNSLPECLKQSLLEKFWDIYSVSFDTTEAEMFGNFDYAKEEKYAYKS